MTGISLPRPHWMDEESGVLAPIVEAFLAGDELDAGALDVLRVYLRAWIDAPLVDFTGDLIHLRLDLDLIATTVGLRAWYRRALELGIEPL